MIFRLIILVMFAIAARLVWDGTAETRRLRKITKDWIAFKKLQNEKGNRYES